MCIRDRHGIIGQPGDFVDTAGHILGQHQGVPYYTIGQRKGLGIALGYPVYVVALDVAKNQVILGREDELYRTSLLAENCNFKMCIRDSGSCVDLWRRYLSPFSSLCRRIGYHLHCFCFFFARRRYGRTNYHGLCCQRRQMRALLDL